MSLLTKCFLETTDVCLNTVCILLVKVKPFTFNVIIERKLLFPRNLSDGVLDCSMIFFSFSHISFRSSFVSLLILVRHGTTYPLPFSGLGPF